MLTNCYNIKRIIIMVFALSGLTAPAQLSDTGTKAIDSLFLRYKNELDSAKKEGHSYITAQKHLQLGTYYDKTGLCPEAINHYNKALVLLDGTTTDTLHVTLNNSLGRVYLSMNNYNTAQTFFEVALQTAETLKFLKGQAKAKSFLGTNYEKKAIIYKL